MSYLAHHGVLGMKWGVRRYQNKDGSFTALGRSREQKQNFKSIRKAYKKKSTNRDNVYNAGEKFRDTATEFAKKSITKEDKQKLNDAKKKWLDLVNGAEDFYDSKECKQASAKAYKDTMDYFKKKDPGYLNTIIKNNKGKTTNLDKFHDFRKMYEGYEDTAWDAAKEKWSKTQKGQNKKAEQAAWNNYMKMEKTMVDKWLGSYGNTKLNNLSKSSANYRDLVYNNVNWMEVEKEFRRS